MIHQMDKPATPDWWLHVGGAQSLTFRHMPPAPLTPLIGREPELLEVTRLLERERVVTLTGAGGCGKTRLAAEVAGRMLARFPGGVAWVELAPCTERDDVVAAIIDLLDIVETPGEMGLDSIVRLLIGRPPMLLVLDNAEHVVAATSDVVAAVITRVPHTSVVCTSREPVGVAGEVVWRVPSLSTPPADLTDLTAEAVSGFDAVRLFADRARRHRRGFVVDDGNAASIAQICVRLDGLPLAIELAAARVRTMPPDRIAAQLDDRFRLLAGGPRTLLARQQTLQASVAWSEGLLDEAEQATFRRLGVFVSGFTVDAAEAVVGSFGDVVEYEVADIIGRLVDKSLVQLDDGRDRYLLLDTIRTYAMQRLLETGELAGARDAHAGWFAEWLERVAGVDAAPDVNEWWSLRVRALSVVDPEWPNCATAIDWLPVGSALALRLVAGLGDYWAMRQRANDSARYGMPSMLAGDRDSAEWLLAAMRMQAVRTNAGDQQFAELRADAARRAAAAGDRKSLLRLEIAGHLTLLMVFGPQPGVLADIASVRAEASELHEWSTVWNAAQITALMLVTAGRPDEAEAYMRPLSSARASLIRSLAAQSRGELPEAVALIAATQSMLDARLGAVLDKVLLTFAVAGAALALDDAGMLHALRPTDFGLDALPPGFRAADSMARGVLHLLAGQLDDARDVFAEREPDLYTSWRLVGLLAQTELSRGDVPAARAAALRLRDFAPLVDAPFFEATATLVLAECEQVDDLGTALDLAHQSLTSAATAGLRPQVIDALEVIGTMLVAAGRARDAARLLSACSVARAQLTLLHRFPHRAAAVATAVLAVRGDDGWAEGQQLPLDDAVEVAQRMRGERVRSVAGWDSLTPTEMQVVEQVAAGLTNPQIAERLLMSRATVKTHLVHVYSKLAIGNRAELAAAVVRRSHQ